MLMWTLHLLSLNPDIEQKLFDEADQVLDGRSPSLEDLKKMPYTDQVINESMRLYPPAWSLMVRRAKEELHFGDTVVPSGSVMLIPMWVVQRNPEVFADPLRFDPQRFAGDWKSRYPKYAYFPFGGGPHVCLGANLAMFEGQIILPMLVRRFHYAEAPHPEIHLQALLTLRPKGGLPIRVIAR
jgi:cytochrome P450